MEKYGKYLVVMALTAGLALVGCSDDDDTGKDTGVGKEAGVDLTPADVSSPDKPATTDAPLSDGISKVGNMGEGCTKNADCTGTPSICLTISKTKGASACSASCIQDDYQTPLVNEDSCPKDFTCSSVLMSDQTYKLYCLRDCIPSETKNPCPATSKTACRPYSSRLVSPGKAVCFYAACTENKDCPVWGNTACTADSECSSLGTGAFCSSSTCALPGKCITAAGICGAHPGIGKKTAKVGDPCKSDLDCPENGYCIQESNAYTTAIGVAYRNGYCSVRDCMFSKTMPSFACPTGSHCNMRYYGGYCFKSCKQADAKGCRGYAKDKGGDYECYDWSGWTTSGIKIAAGPTCQNASTRTCDSVNSKVYCASLASDAKNPTKLSCRDRTTGVELKDPGSKLGVCLDNTTSGPYDKPTADAGTTTADAGAPAKDAGVGD